MLPPGSTIGILGGGQLGRMTVLAAAQLGYRCHIFVPELDSPASLVTPFATVAGYDDKAALGRFAEAVDVVTFEFENVPAETAEFLAARKPVHPGPTVLATAQDRLREKDFLRSIGVATAGYRAIDGAPALARALGEGKRRAVLKTVRLGYDGKGQVMLRPDSDAEAAWRAMGATLGILEDFVDYACEVSVIVARGADGVAATYPTVENRHVNHILDETIAPARVPAAVAGRAEAIARHVAEELGVIGLLAVEMFVTRAGEVLVNELAPRPHNSGHWTLDACTTSQFEQHVRAVCGLPLGSTEPHSDAVMKNLIGDEVESWREILADPAAKLHLYGKTKARPGRKMGHVTRLTKRT
jgi:5-(carboxyamino)imidazole ribonucleotide synthase